MEMRKFHGYTVYTDGVVVSPDGIIMKYYKPKKGNEIITLYYDENSHTYSRARLIATVFIDNPNNYTAVRHKDNNPYNCDISNLEWYEDYRVHGKRAVKCVETGEIFESRSHAARVLGVTGGSTINNYINGTQKDPRGYTWIDYRTS